jgi:hypothetical protein
LYAINLVLNGFDCLYDKKIGHAFCSIRWRFLLFLVLKKRINSLVCVSNILEKSIRLSKDSKILCNKINHSNSNKYCFIISFGSSKLVSSYLELKVNETTNWLQYFSCDTIGWSQVIRFY